MSLSLIEKKLAQLRGHIRLMFLSWGIAKLTIWAAGLTLWLYYTDKILKLPGGLRAAFLAGAVVFLLVLAFRHLVYPLSRTLSDEDLALLVEREYPLLNDRLITSLQLLKGQERYKDAASDAMIRAVVSESFDVAGKLKFEEAVRSRRLLMVVGGSMLALLVLFGHALLDRDDMSLWVRRAMGAGPEWPTSTQLEVLIIGRDQLSQYPAGQELNINFNYDPEARIPELGVTGVFEVAAGSDLRLIAHPTGEIPDAAEVRLESFQLDPSSGRYVSLGGRVTQTMERAARASAGRESIHFAYNKLGMINTLEQLTVRAGDAVAGPFTLRLVPAPALASALELTLTYPEYLAVPPLETQEPVIDAIAGTAVEFRFETTKPLRLEGTDASALIVDFTVGASQRFPLDTDLAAGELRYRARVSALQPGMMRWRLRLVDRQGIENLSRIGDEVKVHRDEPPRVTMLFTGDPLISNQYVFVTPDAAIPLEFEFRDDYGVGGARMFWRFTSDAEYTEHAPFAREFTHLEQAPARHVRGEYLLEFARLIGERRLPAGGRPAVELYIQAFDRNQVRDEQDGLPRLQGSRDHAILTYELYTLDDLRARVSSRIRQVKSAVTAMENAQNDLLLRTREALGQPGLLDFGGEQGEQLRRDLVEASSRQHQLLRDAEMVLTQFSVFAQVYQYNRLERDELERPQETHIQFVRLLLAIAAADRELQQSLQTGLFRLEEADEDDSAALARQLTAALGRRLARALPAPGFRHGALALLLQDHGVHSPGSLERARNLLDGALEGGIRAGERRDVLARLEREQAMSLELIRAVQNQIKRWEGFDDILQGFRALARQQEEITDRIASEARGD
jgi:hypothetical protein